MPYPINRQYRSTFPRSFSDVSDPIPRELPATRPARERGADMRRHKIWKDISTFILCCFCCVFVGWLDTLVFAPPWFSTTQPGGVSPAIAHVRQGQEVAQVIHVLIDSYHDISRYSETVERLRDLAPNLTCLSNVPFSNDLDGEATTRYRHTLEQFLEKLDSTKRDLDFSRLAGTTDKMNHQSLRSDGCSPQKPLEQPRCLCTTREDMEEEAKSRWESMR
jgi:hypothetical protein